MLQEKFRIWWEGPQRWFKQGRPGTGTRVGKSATSSSTSSCIEQGSNVSPCIMSPCHRKQLKEEGFTLSNRLREQSTEMGKEGRVHGGRGMQLDASHPRTAGSRELSSLALLPLFSM